MFQFQHGLAVVTDPTPQASNLTTVNPKQDCETWYMLSQRAVLESNHFEALTCTLTGHLSGGDCVGLHGQVVWIVSKSCIEYGLPCLSVLAQQQRRLLDQCCLHRI